MGKALFKHSSVVTHKSIIQPMWQEHKTCARTVLERRSLSLTEPVVLRMLPVVDATTDPNGQNAEVGETCSSCSRRVAKRSAVEACRVVGGFWGQDGNGQTDAEASRGKATRKSREMARPQRSLKGDMTNSSANHILNPCVSGSRQNAVYVASCSCMNIHRVAEGKHSHLGPRMTPCLHYVISVQLLEGLFLQERVPVTWLLRACRWSRLH